MSAPVRITVGTTPILLVDTTGFDQETKIYLEAGTSFYVGYEDVSTATGFLIPANTIVELFGVAFPSLYGIVGASTVDVSVWAVGPGA